MTNQKIFLELDKARSLSKHAISTALITRRDEVFGRIIVRATPSQIGCNYTYIMQFDTMWFMAKSRHYNYASALSRECKPSGIQMLHAESPINTADTINKADGISYNQLFYSVNWVL